MKIYPEKIILKQLKEIVKNIGLSYRAKPYFSYIHSYLNYVNFAWANTFITNLK